MFSKLKFQHKMLIGPGLAAIAFCFVLTITLIFGTRSVSQMQQVETGYYPSVEMSRDLEEDLNGIQRGLQDAVAAKNNEALAETDALKDKFLQRLQKEQSNPVLDRRDLEQMDSQMRDYYLQARQSTERMISGSVTDDLSQSLAAMRAKYNSIHEKLQNNTARDKASITRAFEETKDSQRRSIFLTFVVSLLCLGPMIVATWYVARIVTRSLLEAVRVANRGLTPADGPGSFHPMLYKELNALQIRVTLPEIELPVWRQLVVPWTWHLGQLHLAIQAAFNWRNCHLHEFNIGGLLCGDVEIDAGDPQRRDLDEIEDVHRGPPENDRIEHETEQQHAARVPVPFVEDPGSHEALWAFTAIRPLHEEAAIRGTMPPR